MDATLRHSRRVVFTAALTLSFVLGSTVSGQGGTPSAAEESFVKDGKVDVNAVVDYFENLYRADSSISTAQLTVTKPNRTKTMTLKSWTRGEEKALIVIQSPPREEGIATLMVEDNLWNYFPRIDRTIRIPPSMMQSSWMGTDFTNDDLVRETSLDEDYRYELIGRTEDPNGWLVRFEARPDTVGVWERFDLIVTPDARLPIQAKYFDRRDRHARTLYWDQVKVFDGRRIPSHMTLVPQDEDKAGHKTEMTYLEIAFNTDVPERMFSLSELEQRH